MNTPSEILQKHEDANEMHFHEVDRKFIIEAMEEYAKEKSEKPINLSSQQTAVEWLIARFESGDMYNVEDSQFIKQQAIKMEKEQSERMYSEEDLKEAFVAGEKHNQWSFSCPSFNEWFEQLKKKSYD